MREVAAVPGRRARAPVVGRGDPRARLAARRARRGAAHLPAPARAAPVRRRRGARLDGAQLRRRRLPGAIARLRARVPHVNVTTDVIVGYPTEDEAAFERTLDARARGRHHEGAHVQLLGAPRHRGRPARRPGAAGGEEAPQPRAARPVGGARPPPPRGEARHDRGGAGRQGRRRRRCPGYSRDYTRYYLPGRSARGGRDGHARAPPSSTRTAAPGASRRASRTRTGDGRGVRARQRADGPRRPLGHDLQPEPGSPLAEVPHGPLTQVLAHVVNEVRDRPAAGQQAQAAFDEPEVGDAHDHVAGAPPRRPCARRTRRRAGARSPRAPSRRRDRPGTALRRPRDRVGLGIDPAAARLARARSRRRRRPRTWIPGTSRRRQSRKLPSPQPRSSTDQPGCTNSATMRAPPRRGRAPRPARGRSRRSQ